MKTTYRELKALCPCIDGCNNYCTKIFGDNPVDQDKEITIMEILGKMEFDAENAFWALKTQGYRDICLLYAEIAEGVLSIFEAVCPNDKAPRNAIDAVRLWHSGKITDEELRNLSLKAQKSTENAYNCFKQGEINFHTAAFCAAFCAAAAADADSFFDLSISPVAVESSSARAVLMQGLSQKEGDKEGHILYTLKKLQNGAILNDFLEKEN